MFFYGNRMPPPPRPAVNLADSSSDSDEMVFPTRRNPFGFDLGFANRLPAGSPISATLHALQTLEETTARESATTTAEPPRAQRGLDPDLGDSAGTNADDRNTNPENVLADDGGASRLSRSSVTSFMIGHLIGSRFILLHW